jgi:hypothetical protein
MAHLNTALVANPLLCPNPDGQYTNGSILKCAVTQVESNGQRIFNAFTSQNSYKTASPWQIELDEPLRL